MTNRTPVLQRLNLTWLLIVGLIVLVADPFGLLAGNYSSDSYSQIRSELSKTKNAKVQLIASWDDFYSLEYNNYWRAEMSTEFVENNYGEVLNAASLGDKYFYEYLQFKGITHLLIPETTEQNGRIFHKFGVRGSIDISLASSYLKKVSDSSGPFASSLFQVIKPLRNAQKAADAKYLLTWFGVGSEFYEKKNTFTEVGMYSYDYNTYYDDGPDVSWFYDQTPDRPGYLEIKYESKGSYLSTVSLEIELVAAYGANAPSHVVIISGAQTLKSIILTSGNPQKISMRIADGQWMKISNGTPCRVPSTFEPSDASLSKICFGVSAVRITPVNQVE